MSGALAVVLQVLLLIVLAWVVVFGGFGAALANRRGGWWLEGFAWGTVLGPVGWVIVLVRTRDRSGSGEVTFAEWSRTTTSGSDRLGDGITLDDMGL